MSNRSRFTRVKMNTRRLLVALIGVPLLAGCGGGAASAKLRIAPPGAPYSYLLPSGFGESDLVRSNKGQEFRTEVALDASDFIAVTVYRLDTSIHAADLIAIRGNVDKAVRNAYPPPATIQQAEPITEGGASGFRYRISRADASRPEANLELDSLFNGRNELTIECWWSAKKELTLAGCEQLRKSLIFVDVPESGNRVSPAGAPYSYVIPNGFETVLTRDNGAKDLQYHTAVSLAGKPDDLISVSIRHHSQALDEASFPKDQLDAGIRGTFPGAQVGPGQRVAVAGTFGFKYFVTQAASPSGAAVDLEIYVIVKQYTELFLNCQWVPADKDKVLAACESTRNSLTID